jgi:hypothetical protein
MALVMKDQQLLIVLLMVVHTSVIIALVLTVIAPQRLAVSLMIVV